MRFLYSLFFAYALLLVTVTISDAALLTVDPAGDGRFIISGSAMDGVAGMKLDIVYDTAKMGKPVVSQGSLVPSGAMIAANTNNPGKITLAIVSTTSFSGSGQVAAINFSTHTGVGSVSIVKIELIDIKGAAISGSGSTGSTGSGFFDEPGLPFSNPSGTQQPQQRSTQNTSTATTTVTAAIPYIGTITLPGDIATAQPQKTGAPGQSEYLQADKAALSTPATIRGEDQSPAEKLSQPSTAESTEIKQIRYANILERFRSFKGERTLTALTALFSRPKEEPARQEPLIAVNEGDSLITVFAGSPDSDTDTVPTVATKGVKLISLKNDESAKGWVIELTPRKGTLDASVSMLLDNRVIEIPLVLITPAREQLSFSETESVDFLKDYGAKKPRFDLNSDGRHDYIDDYLYTGHYLLNKKTAQNKPGTTGGKP